MVMVRSTDTFEVDGFGKLRLHLRQERLDGVHGGDHVGAGRAGDSHHDGGFAVGEAEVADVLDAVGHLRPRPTASPPPRRDRR